MSVTLGEQFAYGHADALLRYIGAKTGFSIWAYVPHGGWHPFWPPFYEREYVTKRRTPLGKEIPQLLWNAEWADRARLLGAKQAHVIGAPWLYELMNDGVVPFAEVTQSGTANSQTRGLYIPSHSIEVEDVQLESTLERVTSTLNPSEFDILLGWLDYVNPRIRRGFEEAGYRLFCAGFRSSAIYTPWSPAGGRAQFLSNFRRIVEHRPIVVADDLTTACLYSASINVRVHIVPHLFYKKAVAPHFMSAREAYLRDQFAWMYDGEDPRGHHGQIKEYLGFPHLLSPSELRNLIQLVPIPE